MDEIEFAYKFFDKVKERGDELQPQYCPFCKGGPHKDKYTFSLNKEKHVYQCFRGSCNAHGHFNELLKMYNLPVETEFFSDSVKEKTVYNHEHIAQFSSDATQAQQPQSKSSKREEEKRMLRPINIPSISHDWTRPTLPNIMTEGVEVDYIYSRKITQKTMLAFGVGGSNGEVVFPFYESKKDFDEKRPTFIKYRPAHKLEQGERKARREKDTKPILFGMHLCDPKNGPLFLFEGEFDAMCGYQVYGMNCVSVPSGCLDFCWVDTCAEFLNSFDKIVIIGDNDAPGEKMIREIASKLNCGVYMPDFTLYGRCKDANEILFLQGEESLRNIMQNTHPVPTLGLIHLPDAKGCDFSQIPHISSGITGIDRTTGGFYFGDLNIFTGRRGEGKSTLLMQIALFAIKQGKAVCVYSGETSIDRYRQLAYQQAAGEKYINSRIDSVSGREMCYVAPEVQASISRWIYGKYWLYDNQIAEKDEASSVLRVFEEAYKRYDCRVFIVDNLMLIRSRSNESDLYHAQADFAVQLRKFAEAHDAIVHLVVHPKKTVGHIIQDNDDVGGLSTLTNIASTVFAVNRVKDEEVRKELDCDTVLVCTKNRMFGELTTIGLDFLPKSRRFVERGNSDFTLGWEGNIVVDKPKPLEEPPF